MNDDGAGELPFRMADLPGVRAYAAAYARLPRNARGALWMLASAITFTVMTMLIKYLGNDYSPALQTFYRQLAGLIVLLPVTCKAPVWPIAPLLLVAARLPVTVPLASSQSDDAGMDTSE